MLWPALKLTLPTPILGEKTGALDAVRREVVVGSDL